MSDTMSYKKYKTLVMIFIISFILMLSIGSSLNWITPRQTNNFFTGNATNLTDLTNMILAVNSSLWFQVNYLNSTKMDIGATINAFQVNKSTGTYYYGLLLDDILDTIYVSIQDINSSVSSQWIQINNLNNSINALNNSINNLNSSLANLTNYVNNLNLSVNLTSITNQINNVNSSLYSYITNVNQTLTNASKIRTYYEYTNLTTSGGNGIATTTSNINFIITRISVYPSSNSTKYRFEATESTSGNIIDKDRALHTGVWDIYKENSISNDKVNYTISSSNPDDTYLIKLTYSDNFR